MTRINTNIASMTALQSVHNAQSTLGTSLTRLSTGLQINTGADNPAGLIQSDLLQSQITSINQSITNSNLASNVISTADAALSQVSNLLDQIRGLVQGGLNTGAISSAEQSADQQQIDSALSAINQISSGTSFAGEKLLDGSKAFTTQTSTTDAAKISDVEINSALFGNSPTIPITATITHAATQASLSYTAGNLTSATSIDVAGSLGSQVLSFGASATVSDINTAINSVSNVTGVQSTLTPATTLAAGTLSIDPTGGSAAAAGSFDFIDTGANNDIDIQTAATGFSTSPVNVQFVTDATGVATTTASVSGSAVTVTLASDTSGNSIAVASDVVAAINGGGTSVTSLVSASLGTGNGGDATNTGAGVFGSAAVVTGSATNIFGSDASNANNGLTFTNATSGLLTGTNVPSVQFVIGAADTTGTSTATVSVAAGTDNITITLASTDGTTSYSKASDIVAAYNSSGSNASSIVSLALDTTGQPGNDGSGVFNETTAAQTINGTNTAGATLTLTSTGYGSAETVSVNALSGSFLTDSSVGGPVASQATGTDIGVNINGQTAVGDGLTASVNDSNLAASISFNALNNVVGTSATVTVTGGGSLFQIGQDVASDGQVGIGIQSINTAKLGGIDGKLFQLGSGQGLTLADVGTTQSNGTTIQGSTLVNVINEAITQVSTLQARLGAVQTNVINTNISTLGVALQNITQAKSDITDTDFAAETANLTRAQILSQASISALSIANQTPNQVLKLLG